MGITELESIQKHGARPAGETIARDIFSSFGQGATLVPEAIANIGEIARDLFRQKWQWPESLRRWTQGVQQFYKVSPSLQQARFTQMPIRKSIAGLFGSLPYTTVAALPEIAGAASGVEGLGILGSMGLVGAQAGGEQYHEAKQFGLTPGQAAARAIPRAIGEATLEFAPAERLMRTLVGRGGGWMRNLFEQALAEGSTEALQQLWQNTLSRTYNPQQPLSAGVLESGVVGGLSGGLMGGLASVPLTQRAYAQTVTEEPKIEVSPILKQYQEAVEKVAPLPPESSPVLQPPAGLLPAPPKVETEQQVAGLLPAPAETETKPAPEPPQVVQTQRGKPAPVKPAPKQPQVLISKKAQLRKVQPPMYNYPTPRYVRQITLPSGQKVLLEITDEYHAEKGRTPNVTDEMMDIRRIRENYRNEVKKYYKVPKVTGKDTNWHYHYNIYTPDGTLIDFGWLPKRGIRRKLLELDKTPNIAELVKKVNEPETTISEAPQSPIAAMLKAEITTPEAIDTLVQQGYTPEQAEATVNAAWEKYSQTLPEIQAKTAKEFISQAVAKQVPYEEAVKKWIERKTLEENVSPEEYAKQIINKAINQPNTRAQLKYIKENLNPNITTDEWKQIRKEALFEKAKQEPTISRDDSLQDIKQKVAALEGYFPKAEVDEVAKRLYDLKESIIPYDNPVALTEDLVEDIIHRGMFRRAYDIARKIIESEEGKIKLYDDKMIGSELGDYLKLLTTGATILEHAGPETAQLVQAQRDIYHFMSIVHSHLHRITADYRRVEKKLSKRSKEKLARWFKNYYDRTQTHRSALKQEFSAFLRRNPGINKQLAWELFNHITTLNDLTNFVMDPIEQMYYTDKLSDVKIVSTDAYQLDNGKVIEGAEYRWLKKQGKVKSGTPVVVAEIEVITQQGVRRQTVVTEKKGQWLKRLRDKARQVMSNSLRPWENYIPHYRSVKEGMYWAMVVDRTIPNEEENTVYAKTFKTKKQALEAAKKWARQHGYDYNSEDVDIIVKQHVKNPESMPLDILPIEVEGWLARMGIDPDSDEAQRIVNEVKTKSGFYSHFLKSRDVEGWEDSLDGFLRGYIQAINTSLFTYQRLKSKKEMLPILDKIEDSNKYSDVDKRLARKFTEAYTKFHQIGGFERWILRSRAFVYTYALANKSTYVLQNALEWMYALPAATEEFIKAGDNQAKAAAKTIGVFNMALLPPDAEVRRMMRRAEQEGLTTYKTWLKYELHPDTADTFIEAITNLDFLGQKSEEFSSAMTFRIGLELGKLQGLHGEALYKYARDFLLGKGKIFMTKGNKIGLFLLWDNTITRLLYPLFVTVIGDILGKIAFRAKYIAPTTLSLLLYILMAGTEGLPFVEKKQFSELSPLGRLIRKGVIGMAGIDTGFLSLNPLTRVKFYTGRNTYSTAYNAVQVAKEMLNITAAVALLDIMQRAIRFADRYHLSLPETLFLMMPAGGLQHLYRNFIEGIYGAKSFNRYKKIYRDVGWRAGSLAELFVTTLGLPTARKFDAWERFKKQSQYRHQLWIIQHPYEYMRQRR